MCLLISLVKRSHTVINGWFSSHALWLGAKLTVNCLTVKLIAHIERTIVIAIAAKRFINAWAIFASKHVQRACTTFLFVFNYDFFYMCVPWKCLVEYDGMVSNEYYLTTIFDSWISKNIFRNNEFDKQWTNDLKDECINKNKTLTAIFLIREITAIKATITVGCQMNAVARWALPFTSITATLGMGCKKYIITFFV